MCELRCGEIEAQALRLPPDQRAALAQNLIASLDEADDVERAWADEAARRSEAVHSGAARLLPAADVFADAPRVTHVEALGGHTLHVTFATGEVRRLDCRPFLDKGVFRLLKDADEFRRVGPINGGGGGWASGADLSRDTVYVAGEPV